MMIKWLGSKKNIATRYSSRTKLYTPKCEEGNLLERGENSLLQIYVSSRERERNSHIHILSSFFGCNKYIDELIINIT